MIVNGFCGDVSTRFYRELKGEDELERVSSSIIQQMNDLNSLDVLFNDLKCTSFEKSYQYNGQSDPFVQRNSSFKEKIQNSQNDVEKAIASQLLHNLEFKASKGEMVLKLYSHIIKLSNILLSLCLEILLLL